MIKKILSFSALTLFAFAFTSAQSLISSTGEVTFHSDKENITAVCNSFTSKLDLTNKEVVFSVPIQGFTFPKAMMQEHFNQPGVMDSQQFPKAKFKGTIEGADDLTKEGTHDVTVKGSMTIKGVTKDFTTTGQIINTGGQYRVKSEFGIEREQFGITGMRPSMTDKVIKVMLVADYSADSN